MLLESFQAALNAGKSLGRIKLLLSAYKIIFEEFRDISLRLTKYLSDRISNLSCVVSSDKYNCVTRRIFELARVK